MTSVPERSEIDADYQWDLDSVFRTDDDWEAAVTTVKVDLDDLRSYETQTTADGGTLLTVLALRDDVMRRVSKIASYARMRSDEDTRNQHYQALSTRARSLAAEARQAASFIEPEIQHEDPDILHSLIDSTDGLEQYSHYIDDVVRLAPHTRSSEIEDLLADLSEVIGAGGTIYNRLLNADVTFPTVEGDPDPIEITQSNFTKLLKTPDRAFRHTVYTEFYDTLGSYWNTVGASLENSVKTDVKMARTRRYDTAREAALHDSNIPIEVYDTLVKTVRENIDVLHRHAELKRAHLDVDSLRMWDLYMPLTNTESPEVEYDTATDHVVASVEPLGNEYQYRVETGLDEGWVDVYENRGKQSGAYSGGTYDTHPFILMNYQDDISSMFTLAHELGHSLHHEYTNENQPYVYSGTEIFVAEVASTVNETLLTKHLLATESDPKFRRHVLNEYLERFRSTLFRQTMFAEFEHQIHRVVEEQDALTPDRLDTLYGEVNGEFYEPVDQDEHFTREWMRIPHFYYNYYVYQYATGISAAVAIVDQILSIGESAAEAYLDALKMGVNGYPLDILGVAGVDMTTADPILDAIHEYAGALDEMESLIIE